MQSLERIKKLAFSDPEKTGKYLKSIVYNFIALIIFS